MTAWDRDRAGDLAVLLDDALPGEGLTEDEVLACCWDDPGAVLALDDGSGAVSVVVRTLGDLRVGYVKVVAVHPGARRLGHGGALLKAAESWAFDAGAGQVRLGDAAPFYLWPGVDVAFTAAMCLAEAGGYRVDGAAVNMSCPTTFRTHAPDGVAIERAVDDDLVAATVEFVERRWPWWVPELDRGIEQATTVVALDASAVVGFACHSVNRAGWVGPMGTDQERRGGGVGAALLSELCRDLMVAGHVDAEISWVGPVSFYAKAAGAKVSRTFLGFAKDR